MKERKKHKILIQYKTHIVDKNMLHFLWLNNKKKKKSSFRLCCYFLFHLQFHHDYFSCTPSPQYAYILKGNSSRNYDLLIHKMYSQCFVFDSTNISTFLRDKMAEKAF